MKMVQSSHLEKVLEQVFVRNLLPTKPTNQLVKYC